MSEPSLVDIAPLPGMHPEIALLAASLQHATSIWRRELRRVTEEALVWQPFEGGHSIGAVLLHMADGEGWWIEDFAAGRRRSEEEVAELCAKETEQEKIRWPKPPEKPLDWYFAIQDRVRERTLKTLCGFGDPAQPVIWSEKRSFTVRWVLNHVAEHENYHGGQAVLLKLLWERRTT